MCRAQSSTRLRFISHRAELGETEHKDMLTSLCRPLGFYCDIMLFTTDHDQVRSQVRHSVSKKSVAFVAATGLATTDLVSKAKVY